MPSHARPMLALVLAFVLVLAGCMGGGGAGGGNADGGGFAAGDAQSAGGGGGAGGGGPVASGAQAGNRQALQIQRALIKTGHVRLAVENFDTAQQNLTTATRRWGGYVSASRQTTRTVNEKNVTSGRLVLRVPSRNFSALYEHANATGTVLSARTNTKDVTGRLVDLRARLSNLRVQRERLRNLYANASDTEDVLAVQKRLSNTQSRIERLEAQLKSLRGRIAYSTITVELTERAPETTGEEWYDIGVIAAFLSSIAGVITTLRAIVVALAYLAPYLLVFGVPAVAVGYVAYRRRGGRRPR